MTFQMPGQTQFTAELADLLKRLGDRESTFQPRRDTYWLPIAEHLVAVGFRLPQRITDPDAADRLPIGTVVINDGGQVAQRYDGPGVWWQILDGDSWDSEALIGTGWIKVLHTPENGDTQ